MTRTGTVTLDTLYEEIKSIRMLLEEIMERGLTNVLPEEELKEKEWQEVAEIEAEVEKGEYVTLEDAFRRHVKKGAKV